MVAGVLSTGGPVISRLRGQELARRELARSIYQQSWIARIWHDITHWLSSLGSTGPRGEPSWWGLTLVAVAVAAAVVIAMYWLGPTRLSRRARDQAVMGAEPRSAREYRDAADQLAATGDYGGAIIERLRAIIADLEARDVLLRRPARTAIELATEASAAFPAEAAELASAAHRFDDVRYGGRAGTELSYRRVRDLDLRLSAAAASPAADTRTPDAQVGLPTIPAESPDADERIGAR